MKQQTASRRVALTVNDCLSTLLAVETCLLALIAAGFIYVGTQPPPQSHDPWAGHSQFAALQSVSSLVLSTCYLFNVIGALASLVAYRCCAKEDFRVGEWLAHGVNIAIVVFFGLIFIAGALNY